MKRMIIFLILSLQVASIHAATTLDAKHVGRYNSLAGFEAGGCEIVDFDPTTKRAFTVNSSLKTVDIIDISDIGAMTLYKRVDVNNLDLGSFVAGGINSVSVCADSMLVALAVEADVKQDNGKVVVIDVEGNLKHVFDAGALPDMVTFSKDGKYILSANEGEPNADYTVDPEGSVTIVDMATKTAHQVSFVGAESKVKGVLHRNTNANFANDLEPEYITLSSDYTTAYVSLQENNAIAVIDIASKTITSITSLGYVDHSVAGNELDVSDKDDAITIGNMPLRGLYQPDGIGTIAIGGVDYIITANEGDAREYDTYVNEGKWDDIDSINLDAANYAGYTQAELDALVDNGLFDKEQLGRKNLIVTDGINDNGVTTALYSFGTRSFTIRKASDLSVVYNSGSTFEKYIADEMPETFNTTDTKLKVDNRSDNKGVEPETAISAIVNGVPYAFIALERHGGIMVYNLTDPANPVFEKYILSRDFTDETDYDEGDVVDNDMSPEGLCFVSAEHSPTGNALLLAGFEVSGTMSAYELDFSHTNNVPVVTGERNDDYMANTQNIAVSIRDEEEVVLTIVKGPFHGTASIMENRLTYEPNSAFLGLDSVWVQATDVEGVSSKEAALYVFGTTYDPAALPTPDTVIVRDTITITETEYDTVVLDGTTAVEMGVVNKELITIYPNPVADVINISTSVSGTQEIYGTNGGKIATFTGSSYNVSSFRNGVYYIVIRNSNGAIEAVDSFYKQ